MNNHIYVVKRNGSREPVSFDKILNRITNLSGDLNVSPELLTQKVIKGIYDGVSTRELDTLSAETAAHMVLEHHIDYDVLAARIEISNLHKETPNSFSDCIEVLYKNNLITSHVYSIVTEHQDLLNSSINHDNDYTYDYFGFKTLERLYLIKLNERIIERPQYMLMRVALGIHGNDIPSATKTYQLLSNKYFTHATPTLFNAGTPNGQLASCFLTMIEDSVDGIYDSLKQCAKISKHAGGIGISATAVRSKGSYIKGTNGKSDGIVPMLRVFDATARFINQAGKRKGSFAIYLEPHHPDIFEFLELRKNQGKEEMRARDLFYALWVPDLFMERVEQNGYWSLFDPTDAPDLMMLYGPIYKKRYVELEQAGLAKKTVKARELYTKIVKTQIETGMPYMLYKDACNMKSNQMNIGTINNSNLCAEVLLYSSPSETSTCNLCSIALPRFVNRDLTIDYEKLREVVHVCVENLNKVIDVSFYPTKEAFVSNINHRPIGIGVQGLADVFMMKRLPYSSPAAKLLNKQLFEAIYYFALEKSCELAQQHGPYSSFQGSPASDGTLQFDMWEKRPSSKWNWDELKRLIQQHGLRNSTLLALMPTASTAQILGNTESFEPLTSNVYTRRTLAGEYVVVNKFLLQDLMKRGLWNPALKQELIRHRGSIQSLPLPPDLKAIYKTVWEYEMKDMIDMSADRGVFIDQTQSFNVYMEEPTVNKVASMHLYGWKKGLKTGMYYLRTRPAADAIQFTVEPAICSRDNPECLACSS